MSEPTQKQTYFYMKVAATSLMVFLLAALYWHAQDLQEKRSSPERSHVPDLSLVSARPPSQFTEFAIGIPDPIALTPTASDHPPKIVPVSHFKDQIVHFIFWASWCQPCQTELPILEKIHRDLNQSKNQYEVVLINLDETIEGQKEALAIQKRLMPSAKNVFVNSRDLARQAKVEAIPFHLILDGNQRVATAFTNTIDSPEKQKSFRSLLLQLSSELRL